MNNQHLLKQFRTLCEYLNTKNNQKFLVNIEAITLEEFQNLVSSNNNFIPDHFTELELKYANKNFYRLAGRYVAKVALRKIIKNVNWKDISIGSNDMQKPIVSISDLNGDKLFGLSITHEKKIIIAAVLSSNSKKNFQVGIDLAEKNRLSLAVKKVPNLINYAFSSLEREELKHSFITNITKKWVAKEAVAKALGVGVWHGGLLKKIEILNANSKSFITLHSNVKEIAERLQINTWQIEYIQNKHFIFAIVISE